MELKPISLKVPVDVLARIDEAAKLAQMSRTALLLGPFMLAESGSSVAAAEAIGLAAKKRGFPTPPAKPAMSAIYLDPITGEPLKPRGPMQKGSKK